MKISTKELLLLIISEAKLEGLTPLKLQKSVFLTKEAYPRELKDFYSFIPYNYGPFTPEIYKDADDLITHGLVQRLKSQGHLERYVITKDGLEAAKKISESFPSNVHNYVTKLIKWIQPLTFQELLSSIYKHYPRYKINSVFRGK